MTAPLRLAVVAADNTVINIVDALPGFGVPDATLVVDDGTARIGGHWNGATFLPPPEAPPAIPAEVSRGQALIALFLHAGVTDEMIAARIAAIPDQTERYTAHVRFQEQRWRRDSPFIAWGAGQFGLSAAMVDGLFVAAAGL
jgi:hypothetical protein